MSLLYWARGPRLYTLMVAAGSPAVALGDELMLLLYRARGPRLYILMVDAIALRSDCGPFSPGGIDRSEENRSYYKHTSHYGIDSGNLPCE